eukprot:TRINITY_DN110145_c0_g1_i1.p1 TRINITY_DN110145_c0_g1~~TRINITY_DN110145_c0_g1_i1.p1  ORF type:complete len:418 (+),score=71.87 TRINITY_DN110145_c0_g1_i1:59-1312(+)
MATLLRRLGPALCRGKAAQSCVPLRMAPAAVAAGHPRYITNWRKEVYSKETHPREWAIWSKLDTDKSGTLTSEEIRKMCRNFDATSHADLLEGILDPMNYGYVTFPQFCKNFQAIAVVRAAARLKHWHRTFGLGVAGNVAGHMEQAGEADSTSPPAPSAATADAATPTAVFTFYAPLPHTIDATEEEVLQMYQTFPVTNAVIDFPKFGANVQVEPEIGLYADIVYTPSGDRVERLVPRRLAAFNDCSIRQLDGSELLREKKNWGFGSKGISLRSFRIHSFSPGSLVDSLVLVSYIRREGQIHQYSVHAPARNYLMFYEPLLDWIVDRINNQTKGGKFEEILPQLEASDYPTSMWIALGAGEYTEWGQQNFLRPKDESLVLLYNEQIFPDGPDSTVLETLFEDQKAPEGVIALHQTFV